MELRAAVSSLLHRVATWVAARPAEAVGLLVVAAYLLPFWAFAVFPSQDGPSHVANARILLALLTGGGGEWASIYRVNLEPFPNWFTHASLAGLQGVLGPVTAEKVFLSAYLLALVASFRFALQALRPGTAGLFVLVLPFASDAALHLGYYNRAFAAVPLLLALGVWIRRGGRLGARGTAVLGLLLLWLFFCAAIGLLVALLGLLVLLIAVTLDERGRGVPDRRRALRGRLLGLTVASLAPLLLLARFQMREAEGVAGPGPGAIERLRGLVTLEWLVALDVREIWLSTALALVLGVVLLAILARRGAKLRPHDALLATAALGTVAYLWAPAVHMEGHGPWGGPSHDRLAPYLPLLFLLWLAAQPLRGWLRRLLLVSAVGISVGFLAVRLPRYAELDGHLREYLSLEPWLTRGATLLPLGFAHHGRSTDGRTLSPRTWPFRHAASWFVASRGVVNVDNYEAQVSFFPVTLRDGYDPYRLLGSSLDRVPSCVRLERFNRLAPRPAEFVLLWGARGPERGGDQCTERLFETLRAQYRLVFTSLPRGQAQLYRYLGRSARGSGGVPTDGS